ncbi:MAG: universal stress protein [Dehalococcoidaceae bacterium]|nr:universal stress protein [Dehalococcoidaceae bacterium]
MFERILVCLDGSNNAEQILTYATAQAEKFKSQLILLQVIVNEITIPPPEWPSGSGYIFPTGIPSKDYFSVELELIQQEQAKAKNYLEGIAQKLNKQAVETVVLQGNAGEAIVGYAGDTDIKLIAMSTHGRSGLERVVFGSVAEYVLKQSALPVLLIRPMR